MRVVLDSNILARATPGKTGPAAVLRLLIRPPHFLILSPFLLVELSRVLRYPRVRALHGLDDVAIHAYLVGLQQNALMVDVASLPSPGIVPHDPDDDPVVQTAVTGKADVLCTLDRHIHDAAVQRYCAQFGISILTDVELLPQLRQQ
jgi:putative PIN family toxin of toxin-antitoxin system